MKSPNTTSVWPDPQILVEYIGCSESFNLRLKCISVRKPQARLRDFKLKNNLVDSKLLQVCSLFCSNYYLPILKFKRTIFFAQDLN
jgi:hypothetical protein